MTDERWTELLARLVRIEQRLDSLAARTGKCDRCGAAAPIVAWYTAPERWGDGYWTEDWAAAADILRNQSTRANAAIIERPTDPWSACEACVRRAVLRKKLAPNGNELVARELVEQFGPDLRP